MSVKFAFPLLRPKEQTSAEVADRIAEARARLDEVRQIMSELATESSALDQEIREGTSQRLATGEPSESVIEEKRARRAEIAARIGELSTERSQLESAIPGAEPMVKRAKLREVQAHGAAARRQLLARFKDGLELSEKLTRLDAEIRPLLDAEGAAWHEATTLSDRNGASANHSNAFSSLHVGGRRFKGLGAMTPKEIADAIRLFEAAIACDQQS